MAKKQCDMCCDELQRVFTTDETDDLMLELYPGKAIVAFAFFRGQDEELQEKEVEIPMNYCPNCGRKLI